MLPHFSLDETPAYQQWKRQKIAHYPRSFDDLITSAQGVNANLNRCNMAIYGSETVDNCQVQLAQLYKQYSLCDIAPNLQSGPLGFSEISCSKLKQTGGYIPYTNRPLSWHTDGYYNSLDRRIGAFTLHCVNPAAVGGVNGLVDHEMVYCHLRDLDTRYIQALSDINVMTIPANVLAGKVIRERQTGPVFSLLNSGHLHMRYSARLKNIQWKEGAVVTEARQAITEFLNSNSPFILRGKLKVGQGLICNNVLHSRSAFDDLDDTPRLLFRARYYDRAGTAIGLN